MSERSQHGGSRPGAGRPLGTPNPETVLKNQYRKRLQEKVFERFDPLIDAKIDNAIGIKHFFLKDERGKFVRLEDPKQIEVALNSGNEGSYYWIFTKDPSTQDSKDLLDRAIDKPADHVEVSGDADRPIVFKWQD